MFVNLLALVVVCSCVCQPITASSCVVVVFVNLLVLVVVCSCVCQPISVSSCV